MHNPNGIGLGLSICKKIAEKLNGKVWVRSALGQGSKFYLSLPTHGKSLQLNRHEKLRQAFIRARSSENSPNEWQDR